MCVCLSLSLSLSLSLCFSLSPNIVRSVEIQRRVDRYVALCHGSVSIHGWVDGYSDMLSSPDADSERLRTLTALKAVRVAKRRETQRRQHIAAGRTHP